MSYNILNQIQLLQQILFYTSSAAKLTITGGLSLDCLSTAILAYFPLVFLWFSLYHDIMSGHTFLAKTKGATEATPLKLPDSMNTCQISAVYASASKSSLTSDGSDISTLTIHPFPYGS